MFFGSFNLCRQVLTSIVSILGFTELLVVVFNRFYIVVF